MSTVMTVAKVIAVDGWTLDVTDDEPRIRDIDLAERAGMEQPRDIRKVIEKSRGELEEFGTLLQRVHCTRYESRPGRWQEREVTEYWLTEPQATTILLQLRTSQARRMRVAVVKVFIAVRRGLLSTPQQVPVLSTSPLVGDSHLRDEFRRWCRMAAGNLSVKVQRIHGAVRRQFHVPGIYQLPVVLYPMARDLVESLAFGRLLLPTAVSRRLAAGSDSTQGVLPFPVGGVRGR